MLNPAENRRRLRAGLERPAREVEGGRAGSHDPGVKFDGIRLEQPAAEVIRAGRSDGLGFGSDITRSVARKGKSGGYVGSARLLEDARATAPTLSAYWIPYGSAFNSPPLRL